MYDAIVVGLGGMGSAAAYALSLRGRRTLGLERYAPTRPSGSSHGGRRIVRQAYFDDLAYVPLLLRACKLWEGEHRPRGSQVSCAVGHREVGQQALDSFTEWKSVYVDYSGKLQKVRIDEA